MAKLATINPQDKLSSLSREIPSVSMLEDANRALITIPTNIITQTNKLIYSIATVILEVLGYTIKKNSRTSSLPPFRE